MDGYTGEYGVVKKLERSYAGLMRSVIYFVRPVSYSLKLVSKQLLTATVRGRSRLRHIQLESIITTLQPALIDTLCSMMYTAYHKCLISVICNSYGMHGYNKQFSLLTLKLRAGYVFSEDL